MPGKWLFLIRGTFVGSLETTALITRGLAPAVLTWAKGPLTARAYNRPSAPALGARPTQDLLRGSCALLCFPTPDPLGAGS